MIDSSLHTTKKRLLRVLAGEIVHPPPFWLMRQAGRYLPEYRRLRAEAGGFLDLCFRPEFAAEATLQPVRRFGMDAAILFSDILVVPHALGQKVEFREGEGPILERLADGEAVSRLHPASLASSLAPVYEAVARAKAALPREASLVGFAGAPWTVATYMVEGGASRDFCSVKRWAIRETDGFRRLIDLLVEATVEHLAAQISAGAEAVQLFDTWSGVLSEPQFVRWSLQPALAVARRVKNTHPGVPFIFFPRGCGYSYTKVVGTDVIDAVGLDSTVPVAWAAAELQGGLAVQGNLDPVALVEGGEAMDREARRILVGFANGPHIFNLGHGVLPETPVENVDRLSRLVRDWRP